MAVALELWVHATGVASPPSFSPCRSSLVATGIEKRGKEKDHLSPSPRAGSRHAFAMLAARPRRRAMEGSSLEGDPPWLLAKHSQPGSWWGNCTLGLGRRAPVHPGEVPEPGSLAALAALIGNDVPAASSHAARAARRRAGATHSPLLHRPGGGRRDADRKDAKLRRQSLDMPGVYFGMERSGG